MMLFLNMVISQKDHLEDTNKNKVMKHIKLFENFNNENEVEYFVERVGNSYRIFALTPRMKSEGLKKNDARDARDLFGNGTLWTDYSTYQSAQDIIDSLTSIENEELEDGGYDENYR